MKNCVKCGAPLTDNSQFCNVCGMKVQQPGTGQPLPRIAYTSSSMQPQLLGERPKKSPLKPIILVLAALAIVAVAAVLVVMFVIKKPGSGTQNAVDPTGDISPSPEEQPTPTPGEDEQPTPTPGEDEKPTPTPEADEPTPTPVPIPDGSLQIVVHDGRRADIIISHSLLAKQGEFYVAFRMPGESRLYEIGFSRQMWEMEADTDQDGVSDDTSGILCEEAFVRWDDKEGNYHTDVLECTVDGDRVTVQAEFAEIVLNGDIDLRKVGEYTLILHGDESSAERVFSAADVTTKYELSEIPVTDQENFRYEDNGADGIVITGYREPDGQKELVEISIPEEIDGKPVVAIGEKAFDGCYWLRAVWIPDSVKEIGRAAFERCRNLARVKLPDGLTAIPSGMFSCGFALEEIEIPDTVTKIGRRAFYGCDSLQEIMLPDKVAQIDEMAFADCTSLAVVRLSRDLKYFEEDMFGGNTELEKLIIPRESAFGEKYLREIAGENVEIEYY